MAAKPSADRAARSGLTPAPGVRIFVIRVPRLSTASSLYPVPGGVEADNADQPPISWDRGLGLSVAANERGAQGVSLAAHFREAPAWRVYHDLRLARVECSLAYVCIEIVGSRGS